MWRALFAVLWMRLPGRVGSCGVKSVRGCIGRPRRVDGGRTDGTEHRSRGGLDGRRLQPPGDAGGHCRERNGRDPRRLRWEQPDCDTRGDEACRDNGDDRWRDDRTDDCGRFRASARRRRATPVPRRPTVPATVSSAATTAPATTAPTQAAAAAGTPKKGGTLTASISNENASLDPLTSGFLSERELYYNMYDSLVAIDTNLKIIPGWRNRGRRRTRRPTSSTCART